MYNNTIDHQSFDEFIKHLGPELSRYSSKVKFIIHQIKNYVRLTDEQLIEINKMTEEDRFELLRVFNNTGSDIMNMLTD